ncbi:MAG: Hydrogenase-4 component B / Formate hydrogenlyase subunit 3 [Burkholderiaceae bacterium]|jgi:hydrogenase-4 component B|nr:MAG: Hydrogenase-4 component B / Formate hydrogenlyase subunit 3 [Burkholderiaceae bacterium]
MTPLAIAFLLLVVGIPVAFVRARRVAVGSAWVLVTAGCAVMIGRAVAGLVQGTSRPLVALALPLIGNFGFEWTPLAALFVAVTAAVFVLVLPFALRDSAGYPSARRGAFVGLIVVTLIAMLALFTASGVVSFIFAWEIAALGIWGLVGFETRRAEPVAAGLLTLALSETGSLAGLVGLLILAHATGTADLDAIAAAAPALPSTLVIAACVLTFFGFGMKAGVVPLNLWLPAAHGAAPRSISPILSGATLNLGLYAFLRLDAPLARTDARLGLMILPAGAATALIGIMYAMVEHDLKRLLAQSSIENMGIVTAGFGAGFTFTALGHPLLGGLAVIPALYHMLNHSAYKTLLFLGAGGLDEAVGTHDLNRMGGLLRRLPIFGTLFIVGAFAIAGLPPSNGFASEWMLLQSLLRVVELASVPVRIVFALSGAALALTAGLAVTCFAMVVAASLLGLPRSREAAAAHRAPRAVSMPMAVLAAACFGLAMLVTGVIPVLGRLTAPLVGADATDALAPAFFGHAQGLSQTVVTALTQLGAQLGRGIVPLRGLVVLHATGPDDTVAYAMSTVLSFAVLIVLLLLAWLLARGLRHHRRVARRAPWDAGLARIRPEMTYTATAFAAPVRVLFDNVFSPAIAHHEQHHGAFLTVSRRREVRVQLVDRLFIRPVANASRAVAKALAEAHHGPVTTYASYVLVALLAALLTVRYLGG